MGRYELLHVIGSKVLYGLLYIAHYCMPEYIGEEFILLNSQFEGLTPEMFFPELLIVLSEDSVSSYAAVHCNPHFHFAHVNDIVRSYVMYVLNYNLRHW